MNRFCRILVCVLVCAGLAPRAPHPEPAEEVRALWVTRTTLISPAAIARMVRAARDSGFNTLFVQVRGRGDAYYSGGIEPRAQALNEQPTTFDPLRVVLEQAHRAGLRVHAWINVGLVSSAVELPASRAHVVYQHPEWLMVPRSLAAQLREVAPRSPRYVQALARAARAQSDDVEGLYLSPVDPAAADYVARVVGDIVGRYPVEGVHLDYVRYPTDEFDYSARALALFATDVSRSLTAADARMLRRRAAADPLAFAERFPDRWRQFRRHRLTALVERVRAVVKARRPRALVTAAVLPDAAEASERRLQDWKAWATSGTIDAVCPMAYSSDADTFVAQVQAARRGAGPRPVWAGIGAYRLSPAQTIESIETARRLGAAGIILFSYDSLAGSSAAGDPLEQIGRAAFGDRPGAGSE